jgi:pyruvate oxidase
MDSYVKVADEAELSEGGILYAELDDTPLALVRLDGQVYALHNDCPHRGGPLAEGWLEDGKLRCPWHGALIDPASGEATSPAQHPALCFKLRVVDGCIEVSR